MKIHLLTLLFCTCFFMQSKAQSHFAKSATFGTSFAPFFDKYGDDPIDYWEFSWSKNAAVQVAKHVDVGLDYINIYNHFPRSKRNTQQYLIKGFVQYVPFRQEKYAVKIELSYGIGNHCTCGAINFSRPYKSEERLNYIGASLIGEWRLKGRLYLDTAFHLNRIINKIEDNIYGYNNASIGLKYRLGKLE